MRTFLFLWNPHVWKWESLNHNISEIENSGSTKLTWRVHGHKKIRPGDRAFLMRLGAKPKGIVATGEVVSASFPDEHWDTEGIQTHFVMIEFDVILDPKRSILGLPILQEISSAYNWTPQPSGVEIPPEISEKLESVWFNFLKKQGKLSTEPTVFSGKPDTHQDGRPSHVIVKRYERNPHARKACIDFHGYSCSVCEFNFETVFGKLGKDFIHVHHLEQLASVGKEHEIDPVQDLRPVCPNCHAMIHRKKNPYSIDELKAIIARAQN